MIRVYVDKDLKPKNCNKKGYKWWKDAIYDPEAPELVNRDIIKLVNKGWKLGEPSSNSLAQNGGVGLYKPLK